MTVIFVLLICLLFTARAKASPGNLEADQVKYYRQQKLVKAVGNVYLQTDNAELWAERMEINLEQDKLTAWGNVKSKDETGEFTGKKLEYDLQQDSGIFIDSEGVIIDDSLREPIYMESKKTNYGQEETKLASPQFTTCNLETSHYHFRAAEMMIHPEDKIIAYHVTFWEFNGTVPLFYTPIWIYSLKDDRNRLQTQFGRNEQKGWFVKNTYNYRLREDLPSFWLQPLEGKFGQLYLDYFSKLGFAGGFKHYYRTLKSDHAYLYLYLEQDQRHEGQGPWITAEVNREIDKEQVDRSYMLNYKNHDSSYLSTGEETEQWEFDYNQTLEKTTWKRNWDIDYDRDETYQHDLGVKFDLDRNDWERDKLGFDVDYFLTDKDTSRTDDWKTKLNYKKYFTEDLYLKYNYNYEQERKEKTEIKKDWEYDTDLTVGEKKTVYDWLFKTELDRSKQQIESYNLPQAELTFHPDQVWDSSLIDPLDITLGGLSRYHHSWYRGIEEPDFKETWSYQRKHGYFKVKYDDRQELIWDNTLNYDQEFQQDIYTGGHLHWSASSKLDLTTELPFNWENKLSYDHLEQRGKVPEGFEESNPQQKLTEVVTWRQGKSNFKLTTGYDFLEQEYDDLTASLDYNFNQHYKSKITTNYNLNQSKFADFESSLTVDYDNFEYNTLAELDLNTGRPLSWKNSLDWMFGRDEWEWHIKAETNYDYEKEKFTTGALNVEKKLHCRKLVVSYDHVKEEVWFQYQILAFPQAKANIGAKEGEGILFGGELGRLIDEED